LIRQEVIRRVKDIIIMRSNTPEMKQMLKIVKILATDAQSVTEKFEGRTV
jgi:hypothetical protein